MIHSDFRITGFLLGTSIAAAYGYYYLLTTLSTQSTMLNGAISDLQSSTTALQTYISKIDTLEKDFKKLEDKVVDKEGLEGVRGEFKKVVAGVRGESLELKERLVGLGVIFESVCLHFREGCCYVDTNCKDTITATVIEKEVCHSIERSNSDKFVCLTLNKTVFTVISPCSHLIVFVKSHSSRRHLPKTPGFVPYFLCDLRIFLNLNSATF